MADHVGTKVSIPGTRGQGILRYYGPIQGKNGIFGGIELIGPIAASRGKNSGSVDGVQYFEVQQPMTGLFLPFERLKSVNVHLANNLRLGSSLRTRTPVEIASTPSPLNRGTTNLQKSNNNSAMKNGMHQSPYSDRGWLNSNQNILKEKEINVILKSKNLSENSPSSFSSSDTKDITFKHLDTRTGQLEKELIELKDRYEKSQLEMAEKMKILNDLRNSVNEIQPLLEEYENDLFEKDKKLNKQKIEFEKARGEWRQSLDLMVSTQQENEEYYEQRISELNSKIEDLSKKKSSGRLAENFRGDLTSNNKELSENTAKIDDLNKQKFEEEKRFTAKIESQQEEIDTLRKNLSLKDEESSKEIKATQQEIDDLKASEISAKSQLKKLEIDIIEKDKIIETLTSNKLNGDSDLTTLLHDVKSVKLNNSDEYSRLQEDYLKLKNELEMKNVSETRMSELENQLEMRPTFEELTDLQNKIDELNTLHKNELERKEDLINTLLKDKENLQSQISDMLQLLEKKSRLDDDLEKTKLNSEDDIPDSHNLPIFVPKQPTDPSSGKNDWCGLCERDGHSSINCPYENDMF